MKQTIRTAALLAAMLAGTAAAHAQDVLWENVFGSSAFGVETEQTADGGYILVGQDAQQPRTSMLIVKTGADGVKQWQRSYGGTASNGSDNAFALDVVQTADGGYVIAGGRRGQPTLMKISATGDSLWSFTYGMDAQGNGTGSAVALARTADGGFVVTGNVFRNGMSASRLHLFKVNASGGLLWAKTYGNPDRPSLGDAVRVTADGGYIVSGYYGQDASSGPLKGSADAYVFKTDADGARQWEQIYPGLRNEFDDDDARDIRQTADGGYILSGKRATSQTQGETDILVMKLDATGTPQWTKTFGGSGFDGAMAATATPDGGYAVAGWESPTTASTDRRIHILKLDASGDEQWQTTLGRGYARDIIVARDGNLVVTGASAPTGVAFLIKLGLEAPQYFVISDAKGRPIGNHEISLYKGTMRPGSDRLVARVNTDAQGRILVDRDWYRNGDSVRAVAEIYTQPTFKPLHDVVGGLAYRIILDNVVFDESVSVNTQPKFYLYDDDDETVPLTLGHATVLLRLTISVEWDADDAYMNEISRGMTHAANYLYDVFDGQVAIEKVVVVDRKQWWKEADALFRASTEIRPNAAIEGFRSQYGGTSHQVMMPRRWFGGTQEVRDVTAIDQWLTAYPNDTWWTFAHELGHQFMGLYDEYKDILGAVFAKDYVLGYMDSHYTPELLRDLENPYPSRTDERYATELSSAERYRTSDQKSRQFVVGGGDCWTSFESRYEKEYGGIYCPIVKPSERTLITGATMFQGPNEFDYDEPYYDASSFMSLAIYNASTEAVIYDLAVTLRKPSGEVLPATGFTVSLIREDGSFIDQGKTGFEGTMKVLGGEPGETYSVAGEFDGDRYTLKGTITGRARKGDDEGGTLAADSTVTLMLQRVDGDYPIVPVLAAGSGAIDLRLVVGEEYSRAPTLTVELDSAVRIRRTLEFSGGEYRTTLDSLPGFGTALLTAHDRSGMEFPEHLAWSTSGFASELFSATGGAVLALDSANRSLQSITWLSSASMTPATGLDPDAEMAGEAHALALRPSGATLAGTNGLTIRYSDGDVVLRPESSIRIHRWNEAERRWEKIGGTVDTTMNEVNVAISRPGTYAAFTTLQTSGVETEGATRGSLRLTSSPSGDESTVGFTLARRQSVRVRVYDGLGRLVATLHDGELAAGDQSFIWSSRGVAAGVYYAVVETAGERAAVAVSIVR